MLSNPSTPLLVKGGKGGLSNFMVLGDELVMSKLTGILSILLGLWLGGQTGCAMNKVNHGMAPDWVGKFPVLVIAHRGFSGAAPENTLAAFEKAMEAGSDMIELDVHLSSDGQVVVIHDDTLNRTTNGKGKVSHHTLLKLKQLDAGSWFGSQFSGEKIPTLKEVLELARGRILVNIELKMGDMGPYRYSMKDLADRSLDEVEKGGMVDQVLFSSLDPSPLERIKERNSRIRVALLYNKPWSSPNEVIGGKPFPILNCRKSVLTEANISKAHQEGIKVNVYTLNTDEEMEQFLHRGVDGIITDHPDRLINILQKRNR
jgi:glycerophosphoryl diester phosphodiesterase